MQLTVGGQVFEAAPLKFIDVRDLGIAGVMAKLRRFGDLEGWERATVGAELAAVSIRRAGTKISAEELMTLAGGGDGGVFVEFVPDLLEASGFEGAKGEAPNAPSPGGEPT